MKTSYPRFACRHSPWRIAIASLGISSLHAAPPPARFSEEALGFFSAAGSRYFLNGTLHTTPETEIEPQLIKAGQSGDPLLKEAAGYFSLLRGNLKQQVTVAKRLGQKFEESETTAKPVAEPTLADVAAEADGEPTQATLNEATETLIEGRRLSRALRGKIAEICKRDQPKVTPQSPSLQTTFTTPGSLQIVNASTVTLHHCIMTTSSTMVAEQQVVRDSSTPPVPGATKEQRELDATRARQLTQQAISAERGFIIYVPELKGGETLMVPFTDLRSISTVKDVRLSFWSDEGSSENTTVRGLLEFRQQAYQQQKQFEEAQRAAGGSQPMRSNDPLLTNEKLEIPQHYTRDGKGTKLDKQPETIGH